MKFVFIFEPSKALLEDVYLSIESSGLKILFMLILLMFLVKIMILSPKMPNIILFA